MLLKISKLIRSNKSSKLIRSNKSSKDIKSSLSSKTNNLILTAAGPVRNLTLSKPMYEARKGMVLSVRIELVVIINNNPSSKQKFAMP